MPASHADEIVEQFGYLLHAMEAAAQADSPYLHDYGPKRQAVLAFVRTLAEGKVPNV